MSMSEEVRHVSLAQLDEMLDAGIQIAERQAEDYIRRGQSSMATHVLTKAIEERSQRRASIVERSQQLAPQRQPEQPAAPPAPATGPLAAPGTPPPVVVPPHFATQTQADVWNRRQTQLDPARDPRVDVTMPFGLGRRRP